MSSFKLFIILTLSVLYFCSSALGHGVFQLTDSNFEQTLKSVPYVFAKFYAPWCGYCQRMAPDYEKLANTFAHVQNKVIIADLNGDDHRETVGKFSIRGYPTLFLFKQGVAEPIPYPDNKPRSYDDMVAFITEQTGLTAKGVASTGAAAMPQKVVNLDSATFDSTVLGSCALVKFYAPWCGHCKTLAPVYEKLATIFQADEDVKIAKVDCTVASELGDRFSIEGFPTLKLFINSTTPLMNYNGPRELKALVSFINSNCAKERAESGDLRASFGRTTEMDSLATQFMAAPVEDMKKTLLEKIKTLIQKSPHPEIAKFYTLYMERVLEKGSDYIGTELERLQDILAKGGLTLKMKDSFTVRSNILKVFQGTAEPIPASIDLDGLDGEEHLDL